MGVSIIIPVHNEEDTIGSVLEGIDKVAKNIEKEIIVVDDGSTDRTQSQVTKLAKRLDIHLIIHQQSHGYGASIKEGIRNAKYEHVLIIDGDGTYPVEAVPELVEEMEGADMVVGARTGKDVKSPFFRRPAKFFLNRLASYLVGMKIPDLNSGLRVFNREAVLRFFSLLPDGFSFTSTLTLGFSTNGYSVKYIPINYYPRKGGRSKINPARDLVNFFILIIRTVMYFNPLKIFLPMSLIVIVIGLFILLYTTVVVGRVMDITSIVILLSGIQIGVIGLLADLIVKRIKL